MLQLRVIEESQSAWSSPVVLVPKPDGSFSFCNDFRRLDEVSEFDAYPMPRVDELIERLGPARYLTNLGLNGRYWQVRLSKTAREKTAFATPGRTIHGAPLRSTWRSGHLPAHDGPSPVTTPGLFGGLHR